MRGQNPRGAIIVIAVVIAAAFVFHAIDRFTR
jgi:hypothetical protein